MRSGHATFGADPGAAAEAAAAAGGFASPVPVEAAFSPSPRAFGEARALPAGSLFDADARRQSGAGAGVGPGSAPDAPFAPWVGEDAREPVAAWRQPWSPAPAAAATPLCAMRRHAPSPRRPPLRALPHDVGNRQPPVPPQGGCFAAVLAAVSAEIAEFADATLAPMDPDSPLQSPFHSTPMRHADTAPPGQPPENRSWRFAVGGAAAEAETPSFGRAWEAELHVYEEEACTPLPSSRGQLPSAPRKGIDSPDEFEAPTGLPRMPQGLSCPPLRAPRKPRGFGRLRGVRRTLDMGAPGVEDQPGERFVAGPPPLVLPDPPTRASSPSLRLARLPEGSPVRDSPDRRRTLGRSRKRSESELSSPLLCASAKARRTSAAMHLAAGMLSGLSLRD